MIRILPLLFTALASHLAYGQGDLNIKVNYGDSVDIVKWEDLGFGSFKEIGLIGGYNLNRPQKNEDGSTVHLFEIGIRKSRYDKYHHYVQSAYYFSNEFSKLPEYLIYGSKVGGYVGFYIFILGLETIIYTNFREEALRISPYWGIGNHMFKLTFNPHIALVNKEFSDINSGTINLTVQLLRLNKKKI